MALGLGDDEVVDMDVDDSDEGEEEISDENEDDEMQGELDDMQVEEGEEDGNESSQGEGNEDGEDMEDADAARRRGGGVDTDVMPEGAKLAVYDPSFLLPLILGALSAGFVTSLSRLVDDGVLSYILVSLSSRKKSVRVCAYSCLYHILRIAQSTTGSYGSYGRY